MKKGFTLSELMITMVILGVLCAAVIPAVVNNMPNQKKMMIKRVLYLTSNIVRDMLNNSTYYQATRRYTGFENLDEITYKGTTYSGDSKFAEIFISLLQTKGDTDTSTSNCSFHSASTGCRTVYTSDGMRWSISIPSYSTTVNDDGDTVIDDDQLVAYILVDTNGTLAPNLYQTSTSTRTKDFDQFIMEVWMDGTLELCSDQNWAKDVINATSSITDTD